MMISGVLLLFNLILFIGVPILLIFLLFQYLKRFEKRAEEKLQIEKQHTITLQKKVDAIDERLMEIEKMLKEVE